MLAGPKGPFSTDGILWLQKQGWRDHFYKEAKFSFGVNIYTAVPTDPSISEATGMVHGPSKCESSRPAKYYCLQISYPRITEFLLKSWSYFRHRFIPPK